MVAETTFSAISPYDSFAPTQNIHIVLDDGTPWMAGSIQCIEIQQESTVIENKNPISKTRTKQDVVRSALPDDRIPGESCMLPPATESLAKIMSSMW